MEPADTRPAGGGGLVPAEQGDAAQRAEAAPGEGTLLAGAGSHQSPASLYETNCAVCHGRDGRGNIGPALAGNGNLASATYTVARIQLGGGGMPPFARLLSAREIAGLTTLIRTSWENDFGPVAEELVDVQWNGFRRGMRYGTYNLVGGD